MLLPFPCLFGPCLVFHSHDLFHVYCFLISEFLKYFWELIMINKCYIYNSASQAFRAHPGHTHLPNAISPRKFKPPSIEVSWKEQFSSRSSIRSNSKHNGIFLLWVLKISPWQRTSSVQNRRKMGKENSITCQSYKHLKILGLYIR